MATLPALNAISTATNQGILKQALEDLLAGTKQIVGAGVAKQALTLSGDQVTPATGASGVLIIDTEAAAATDNLANIIQTNFPDNSAVLVGLANAAHLVVVKHAAGGSGQISLRSGGDFTLGDTTHWLWLKREGALWVEIARFPADVIPGVLTKAGAYTTVPADREKVIEATTGTWTLSLLAVATAGKNFGQIVKNSGSGVITIDPNSTELIDGQATLALAAGQAVRIVCDGTGWKVVDVFVGYGTSGQWLRAGGVTALPAFSSNALPGTLTAGTSCVKNPAAVNTATTQAHGLAAIPKMVECYLECLTAEMNYAVGDRVFIQQKDNAAGNYGFQVEYDATNVRILIGNQLPSLYDRTTPTSATPITAANWKVVAVPYGLN